jgi:TM2 domain-containing membrane protein YozV
MAEQEGPKRVTCAICALIPFVNLFAVHKFMLGQTMPAILQICANLACGAGAWISFIEGIIYLMKTDEEWHKIYVVDKKAWF